MINSFKNKELIDYQEQQKPKTQEEIEQDSIKLTKQVDRSHLTKHRISSKMFNDTVDFFCRELKERLRLRKVPKIEGKTRKQVLEDYNSNKYHTAKSIVVKAYERTRNKSTISEYLSNYKSIKKIKKEPPFYEDLDFFKTYFMNKQDNSRSKLCIIF